MGRLIVVSGGAASGKSEYAESLVLAQGDRRRVYLATMAKDGAESDARIARHRRLRRGKGFETVERPRDLAGAAVPGGSVVLLECLSNLAANECFGPEGFDAAEARILSGVDRVLDQADCLVAVTNELFSDGIAYDPFTMRYLGVLAAVNRGLARRAETVIEVVCGIPVIWKGEKP